MFLVDTNIFLEILLEQEQSERCKEFLSRRFGSLRMSDFTLHSIGVILFKYNKDDAFQKFVDDVTPKITILSLPALCCRDLPAIHRQYSLDFDDCYQFRLAKHHSLQIVTLDKDFGKVTDQLHVVFLKEEAN